MQDSQLDELLVLVLALLQDVFLREELLQQSRVRRRRILQQCVDLSSENNGEVSTLLVHLGMSGTVTLK